MKNHNDAHSSHKNGWSQVCDQEILSFLNFDKARNKSSFKTIILLFTASLIILSLAGPTWHKKSIKLQQNNNSWIIVLNMSESMQKNDVTPSRLQRAKYKIKDFLNYITDEQLGFIVFADDAYDIIPLTHDKSTIEHVLPSIDPLIMPGRGSNLNSSLLKSKQLINNLNLKSSNLLILTDSSAKSKGILTAKQMGNNNITINVINFEPNSVINNTVTKELCNLSGGICQSFTYDDSDIKKIINNANNKFKLVHGEEQKTLETTIWNDMGPFLMLIILPLLFLALYDNKSSLKQHNQLLTLTLIFILPILLISNKIYANNHYSPNLWDKLWLNEQEITAKKFQRHDESKIESSVFQNSKWQAAAEYKNGNYKKSAELLAGNNDETSIYNYANSLAKQGDLPSAIKNYKKLLEINPNHSDAKYNKKLLEEFLAKQNKDNQQNQSNQENQDNSNQAQNQEQNQNQNQEQNQDQNQEQNQANNQNNTQNQQEQQEEKDSQENNQNKNSDEDNENKEQQLASESEQQEDDHNEQMQQKKLSKSEEELNNWLDKIPDNPAMYLRNQLQYEYWQKKQMNN